MKRGESTIAQGKPRSGAALGMEKKANGARRSEAEEADSSRAPSIPRKSLALIQIKRAPVPARSVASLPASRLAALACYAVARRSSPLSVGLRCVADAPSLRAQFHFFTLPKVTLLTQLHLGLLHFRPAWRGSEFRSLTLANTPTTSDLSGGCTLHAYTNAHPGDGVGVWLRGGQYNSLSFETGPQKRTGELAFCCSLRDSKCLRAHIILRFSLVRKSEERLLPLVSTTK